MQRRFILFFLAFATLFASVHASAWSHDHVDSIVHVLEASHVDYHNGAEAAPIDSEAPLDNPNISGEVPHQHITAVGLEANFFNAGFGIGLGRSLSFPAPTAMLTSRNSAPPLEPPSA